MRLIPPIEAIVDVGVDRHQQALTVSEHVRAGHAAVTVLRS